MTAEYLSNLFITINKLEAETTEQKQLIKELVEGLGKAMPSVSWDTNKGKLFDELSELLTRAKAHV